MMPVIRISEDVFRKLQLLAEPLVDTPGSVIEKLLDPRKFHFLLQQRQTRVTYLVCF